MKQAILLLLTAALALPGPAAANDPPRRGEDGANIHIDLTLTDGESEWPIRALVLDGQRLRTTTGRRVPMATEVGEASSSISYLDVGMEARLEVRIVGAGRVRVSGEVELSAIDEERTAGAVADQAPKLTTFRHVFDVVLADGVATPLAEVPDLGKRPLELTAVVEIRE